MKNSLILLFLFFVSLSIYGQQHLGDSLKNILNQNPAFTEAVVIEQQLADWYRSNEQFEEAINVAEKSLKTAQSISNNNINITKAYWVLANIYANMDEYEKARQYVDMAYQSANQQKDPLPLAYAHYAEAILQSRINDKEKALKNLHEALSGITIPENEPLLVSRIYYLLYNVYTDWDDDKMSLSYAVKAKEYALKSGNKNQLANAYIALAVAYKDRYKKTKNKTELDSTMLLLNEGIELHKTNPGKIANNTYGILCLNKASYLARFFDTGDPNIKNQVTENLEHVLSIKNLVINNQGLVASSYGILSDLAMKNNDLKSAEAYLTQAYQVIQSKEKSYYHTLINVTNGLSNLYAKSGDYKRAWEFQTKSTQYNSLLFDESIAANTKRLEAQYEFSKKEQEVKVLKDKAESHRKQNYLLMGLIGIGLVGAFFMFRSYHFNLRYSLVREKQLTAERHEAEMQVKYEKEEQARLKAEQQLLELQQQKLQDAVMTSQLHIQHKKEVLQQLKEKISNDQTINIKQVLKDESLLDDDFENAQFRIQKVHPHFFKNLNEKATQKLTSLDLKYCAYFYLGMDTKQVASLLNVEPKSVRMTKYRLKQKFELDAETDLIAYLKEINIS